MLPTSFSLVQNKSRFREHLEVQGEITAFQKEELTEQDSGLCEQSQAEASASDAGRWRMTRSTIQSELSFNLATVLTRLTWGPKCIIQKDQQKDQQHVQNLALWSGLILSAGDTRARELLAPTGKGHLTFCFFLLVFIFVVLSPICLIVFFKGVPDVVLAKLFVEII